MKRLNSITKPLMWLMALALAAAVAGCGGTSGVGFSSAKAITAYSLAGSTGIINETAKTIAVTVPYNTNLTALVATFTTTGDSLKVGTTIQSSGTTPNNFTSPVVYTVTAADGTTVNYTVTVTVALGSAKAITAYSFVGFSGNAGVIDEAAKTIAVTLPTGTVKTALVANFTTTGASVKVGTTVQVSATTANDFTSPVAYIVTAGDASTATYTVTVTVAPATSKAVTVYSFVGFDANAGVIDEAAKTIAVSLPTGADKTTLIANFTTTGASVSVGGTPQVSRTTANNFTSSVAYRVTAADASFADYVVTVTVASSTTDLPGAGTNPTVTSASPTNLATNVPISSEGVSNAVTGKQLIATFSEAMDPNTINSSPAGTLLTFTLKETVSGNDVPGTVAMNTANTVATFTPTAATLTADTDYTATITTAAHVAAAGNAPISNTVAWSFRTKAGAQTYSQLPLNLARLGTFAIFSNTAVTSVFQSNVAGNIGTAGTASNTTITCPEVTAGGRVWTVAAGFGDAACETIDSAFVNSTAGDLSAAITDAKGRTFPDSVDDQTGLAGNISGLTLTPGLYKWNTGVLVSNAGITITGGANDVWIFQISGDLTLQDGAIITLGGAAQAKNIFWQVAGGAGASLGVNVDFKGIILADAGIQLNGGLTTPTVVNGRLFASPAITLNMNTITPPAP